LRLRDRREIETDDVIRQGGNGEQQKKKKERSRSEKYIAKEKLCVDRK
jgi:hypothetical protein